MKKTSGQGLVETLLVVLFVFMSASVILVFSREHSYDRQFSKQRADALTLANNRMDTYRGYSVINTTAGYVAYQDIATGSISSTVSGTTYTIATTVTTNTAPDYKVVSIVVSWPDSQGVTKSVAVVSNIASIDPSTQGQ